MIIFLMMNNGCWADWLSIFAPSLFLDVHSESHPLLSGKAGQFHSVNSEVQYPYSLTSQVANFH